MPDPMTAAAGQVVLMYFLTLGPIATAMIEDTVFRHTLLLKLSVWNNRILAAILVLANAVVFLLIHMVNNTALSVFA